MIKILFFKEPILSIFLCFFDKNNTSCTILSNPYFMNLSNESFLEDCIHYYYILIFIYVNYLYYLFLYIYKFRYFFDLSDISSSVSEGY